jgi:feruloyl esterase
MIGLLSSRKWLVIVAGAALALCFAALGPKTALAQPGFGPPIPAGPCGDLQKADFTSIPGAPASIISTGLISATDTQPEYCEVYGLIASQIQFKVWLPSENWNERYLQVGCGGYCGSLDPSEQCYTGLAQNSAVAFDNSGHISGGMMGGGDALWGYDNMGLREDFGYRSEHVTALVAKAIVAEFYGKEPTYSYYFGCSNGGRQALQEAQRWPEDFDGIVAGAPAAIQAPLNGEYQPWNGMANIAADGSFILEQAQFQLLNEAALANCDSADGLEDGQITDPRRCDFDPGVLLCKAGQAPTAAGSDALPSLAGDLPISGTAPLTMPELAGGALPLTQTEGMTVTAGVTDTAAAGLSPFAQEIATAVCLTETQIEAARKLYGGPVTAEGEALYPGRQAVGSELAWPGWMTGMASGIGSGYLKYLAFAESPEPSFTVNDWVFDVEGFDSLREMGEVYNATNPDLSAFAGRGGKLILYHGWADPAISPFGTLAYYQAVVDTVGDINETQEFARLFMVPGMFHCSGGNAPSSFDMLGPIQDWVEHGVSPEQIIATQYAGSGLSGGFADPTEGGASAGEVVRTRPLCPFPLEQTYDGSGNIDDAASFSCETPQEEGLASGAYDWVGSDLFTAPTDGSSE